MAYTTEEMREYQRQRREDVKLCKTDEPEVVKQDVNCKTDDVKRVNCKTEGVKSCKTESICKTDCKSDVEVVKPRYGLTDTGEPYFPPEPTLPNGYIPKSSFELRYLYKKSHPNELCMICLDHNRACKCDPFAVKKFLKVTHSDICDCLVCKGLIDKKTAATQLKEAVC